MTSTPLFVVGTGRCGSTLVSSVLRLHPEILSVSELFRVLGSGALCHKRLDGSQFWRLLSIPGPGLRFLFDRSQHDTDSLYRFDAGSRFRPADLPPILYVTLPHITADPDGLFDELMPVIVSRPRRTLAEQYLFLFDWLTRRFDQKLWVERSGASIVFVSTLKRMYPDARFIHIFRDGRDVAMSICGHTNMRLYVQGWLRVRRFGINALKEPLVMGVNPIYHWLEPLAFRLVDVNRLLASKVSPYLAGEFWAELIRIAKAELADLPEERCLQLRYESLVAEPERELDRLIRFIDPSLADDRWLKVASALPKARPHAWRSLQEADRARLVGACEEGLNQLGYI